MEKFNDIEIIDANLPSEDELNRFMLRYHQLIMLYESAVQLITIKKECEVNKRHIPISSLSNRI